MIDRLLARYYPAPIQDEVVVHGPPMQSGFGFIKTEGDYAHHTSKMYLVVDAQPHALPFVQLIKITELRGLRLRYWQARWAVRNRYVQLRRWWAGRDQTGLKMEGLR